MQHERHPVENRVNHLERDVESIKNNMAQKSDIAQLRADFSRSSEQTKEVVAKVGKLSESIEQLVVTLVRKEESDKHQARELERLADDVDKLKDKVSDHSDYIASDKPFKDMRARSIQAIVVLIISAIAVAIGVQLK